MRKQRLLFLLASILLLSPALSHAQGGEQGKEKYRNKANDPVAKLPYYKKLRWADGLYKSGSYFNAIEYYQQLKQEQERNPYITYQLAECYYMTRDYVPAAKYFLEVYASAPKLYPEAIYKGATQLKQQGRYEDAVVAFNRFITDNPKTYKKLKKRAQREIDGCNMAMTSIKDPQAVNVVNAGPNVNSAYTELSPVPLGDTALLFASMSQNQVVTVDQRHRGEYMSRFLVSHKQYEVAQVDSFQWPLKFTDGEFNDPKVHVGNGAFSPGGERFYFTKCTEGDSMSVMCKIYVSKFEGSKWGTPELLGDGINDDGSNTQPNIAKVGKKEVLFFSSNRKLQNRGGYDIWYSIVDPIKNTYRRPQNVGKTINTEGDEVTPYYDSRVGKLYYSSNGLVGFGGFDVYSADGGPSRYSNVTNLGYPINTSADELYFIKDPVGKPDGYLVSNRIGSIALKNPTCCDDIWRVQYEPRLMAIGKVINNKTKQEVTDVVVKINDETGNVRTYNSTDGNFGFSTPRSHNYVITGDKPNFTSSRATISTMDIKRTDPDDTVRVTIYMDSTMPYFRVSNIYYDFDKATLRPTSVASLDSLVAFMKDNPSLTVEIYSHADAKGDNPYNRALSKRRAESVANYLTEHGVERPRLIAKGFGSEQPVAPNKLHGHDDPEGRQMNRRTEFRIVSEVPSRHIIFNSAKPGSLDQQEKNLRVNENGDEDDATDKESNFGKPGSRVNQ